ncbi:MAG: response regulator transcription factor [Ignavibacteriaceae bacterium]|nr:response regulator transcription factor [Ignavibacteriaceae bacterium]
MENNEYKGARILLVEDEETLAGGLEFNLTDEGYLVKWARDGREALKMFDTDSFDLIILDIMLPYYDGFEIAKKIRTVAPQMPILMLSARTSVQDKIKGLEQGADDYMTKPFHLEELLLRIKGMLKRKLWYKESSDLDPVYSFGSNQINFENFTCVAGPKKFSLTQREAMIMKYLIEKKGKIVSRKELLENVWHISPEIETRTVDIFISHLRKYFELDPENPIYITSIRNAGYQFNDENGN